jgi:hypothetical protein
MSFLRADESLRTPREKKIHFTHIRVIAKKADA